MGLGKWGHNDLTWGLGGREDIALVPLLVTLLTKSPDPPSNYCIRFSD